MKDHPVLRGFKNEGMTLEQIIKLEADYNKGKLFPQVLREFLFLAGEYNNVGYDIFEDLETLQEMARTELKYNNKKIDRPFFVFDQLTGCEVFTFIYLDEHKDDPDVYHCYPYYHNEPLIQPAKDFTFVSLTNEHVRRLKEGLPL